MLRQKRRVARQRVLAAFFPQEIRVESTSRISSAATQDTLRGICDHKTIKQIAASRGTDVSAIYKQRDWLRKNGYLNAHNEPTGIALECFSGGLRTLQSMTRYHDLRFRVEILRYRDPRFAARRREYLELANIPYSVHKRRHWEGFMFAVDRWRVEVTPRSFLLLAPDMLVTDAHESLLHMYEDVKRLVKKLEARFAVVALEKGDRLNVRVEGQHAALVHDALARRYNADGRTFELRDAQGRVRLVIDNSLKMQEFEAVHPVYAVDDEAKIKRLYHEAVIQDISLQKMQEELSSIKQVLQSQVEVQRLEMEAGVRSHAQIRKLTSFFGGDE